VCVIRRARLGCTGDTVLNGLERGMRCGQEVPYTHVRGRNHLALQSSRFSHDCESRMRCTRVTKECRRRQKYSVEAQREQPAFSTVSSPSRAGYAEAMVPRY
jgi:hypothetical protein